MPLFEALRLALQTIRTQKLKSGFSLLGVFIGVASLIGAWSIVNGVNRYMTEKFAQTLFGVNTFQLRRVVGRGEAGSAGYVGLGGGAGRQSNTQTVFFRDKQARDIELTAASERY